MRVKGRPQKGKVEMRKQQQTQKPRPELPTRGKQSAVHTAHRSATQLPVALTELTKASHPPAALSFPP